MAFTIAALFTYPLSVACKMVWHRGKDSYFRPKR